MGVGAALLMKAALCCLYKVIHYKVIHYEVTLVDNRVNQGPKWRLQLSD